jgi:L-arabinokinase
MNTTTFTASAPGRLDVMGGIADYSGSLVLQKAIIQQTSVELNLRNDYQCSITSYLSNGEVLTFKDDLQKYLNQNKVDYQYAQQLFHKKVETSWVTYILGCVLILMKEKNIDFKGADFTFRSTVPHGKGVASSASLEIATMKVLEKAFALSFFGTELARYAQQVENHIAGAPCGLMDQLASYFGSPDALLPIICQPDHLLEPIPIPKKIAFVGIDSGIRHQVSGASYGDVRCAAFMGYSIIAQALGINKQDIMHAKVIQDFTSLPFQGYLSKVPVDEFEHRFQDLLPEKITGSDFLKLYGETIDPITTIAEDKTYAVKICTAHPIYENQNVNRFMQCLTNLSKPTNSIEQDTIISEMGSLMLASHKSYSACGLGTGRTDDMVNRAMALSGISGARITGGGNGGTICLLVTDENGVESAKKLHHQLSTEYKEHLAWFE